jgi:hypothetical protein
MSQDKGIELAEAAQYILGEDLFDGDGPTLEAATQRIEHLDGTKADFKRALAYMTCQWRGTRKTANFDADLALHQIDAVMIKYRERRG